MQTNNIKKWYTQSTWVDLQTGEEINKKEVAKNYIILRKKIKYEIREQYGIRHITNECTKCGKQQRLF